MSRSGRCGSGNLVLAKESLDTVLQICRKVLAKENKGTTYGAFSASGTPSGSAAGWELRKCGHGSSIMAMMAPLDQQLFETLYTGFAAFVRDVPDARKSTVGFEVYSPYPILRTGQSGTAYAKRGYQINVQVVPTWTEEMKEDFEGPEDRS